MRRRSLVLSVVSVAAACVLALPDPASAQSAQIPLTQAVPTLTVTGAATLDAQPDIVTMSFAVITEKSGKDAARTAMEENSKRAWEVIEAMKSHGLGEKEIETGRVRVQPKYDYSGGGGPRITGFVAENRIVVRTKKLEDAGAIIASAVDAGANRVDGVEFGIENSERARREALERAGAAARADAEALAKGAGVRIGRTLQVTVDQPPMAPTPMYAMSRSRSAMEAATPAPVDPGTVAIEARVTIVFEVMAN